MVSPDESNFLFRTGNHPWNLQIQARVLFIPARVSKNHQDLIDRGFRSGMPIPQTYHTLNGTEEMLISVEAGDGNIYTGIAARYFDRAHFFDMDHKVQLLFLLGDEQSSLHLDDRMKQLGFDYFTEPIEPD